MTSRVLVTYASKHGATAEIAERIGQVLIRNGLYVDIMPIEEVQTLNIYQAVVLGSAVYAGQWRREAVDFLESHKVALTNAPLWIFSSGPTGEGDPEELLNGWRYPQAQDLLIARLQPKDTVVFHGVLEPSTLNLAERVIVRGVKAPIGDFRNWESINQWATEIAEAVRQIPFPT